MKIKIKDREIEVTQEDIIKLHTGKLKIEDLEKRWEQKPFVAPSHNEVDSEGYTFYDDILDLKNTHRIVHKPLSVNEVWQGKRYKTPAYKAYEKQIVPELPEMVLPDPPYRLTLEWGFSSASSDWDNPIKPFQDILSKHYGFNDKLIFEGVVRKRKVKRGQEYIQFKLEHLLL